LSRNSCTDLGCVGSAHPASIAMPQISIVTRNFIIKINKIG